MRRINTLMCLLQLSKRKNINELLTRKTNCLTHKKSFETVELENKLNLCRSASGSCFKKMSMLLPSIFMTYQFRKNPPLIAIDG